VRYEALYASADTVAKQIAQGAVGDGQFSNAAGDQGTANLTSCPPAETADLTSDSPAGTADSNIRALDHATQALVERNIVCEREAKSEKSERETKTEKSEREAKSEKVEILYAKSEKSETGILDAKSEKSESETKVQSEANSLASKS